MNLSDEQWSEVVAQLRKWVRAVVRPKSWILCGYTVDDVISDAFVRYFEREHDRDHRICELYPPEQRVLGLTRLLSLVCRGVIVDRWRSIKDGVAREQPQPADNDLVPALVVDPNDQYDYNSLKRELWNGADGTDKAIIDSFFRLAEGQPVAPNQQVAEDARVPIEKVLSFKKRWRRGGRQ